MQKNRRRQAPKKGMRKRQAGFGANATDIAPEISITQMHATDGEEERGEIVMTGDV